MSSNRSEAARADPTTRSWASGPTPSARWQELSETGSRTFYHDHFQQPGRADAELDHDVGNTLRSLGGAADPAFERFERTYDRMETYLSDLRSKTLLEGVGHGAAEEAPEDVTGLLRGFLESLVI